MRCAVLETECNVLLISLHSFIYGFMWDIDNKMTKICLDWHTASVRIYSFI